MKTVAIIGGNGYVGNFLTQFLCNYFSVTVLTRGNNTIVKAIDGVTYLPIDSTNDTFDVIINTSYSIHKNIKVCYSQNKIMCDHISRIAAAHTKIIHLSSLAVFGFCLDFPIKTEAIENRNDYIYVSSKIDMENALLKHFDHHQLSIVRLGNVWGPENNSWTQPVANALNFGMPCLYNTPSFSNLTYIHNITDYIKHIIVSEKHLLFHHLAEFSNTTWQQIIEVLGHHLHKKPVQFKEQPYYSLTSGTEIVNALKLTNPLSILKKLKSGRYFASPFSTKIATKLIERFGSSIPKPNRICQSSFEIPGTFYWVLGCQKEFTNTVLTDWRSPYSIDTCLEETQQWLSKSGFVISQTSL
jgi:nucleoside-diphosphate-sugar epimerase